MTPAVWSDNTGEPLAEHRKLIFDALRFVPAELASPLPGDLGTDAPPAIGPGTPDSGVPASDGARPASGAPRAVVADGGCDCAAAAAKAPHASSLLLLLAAVLALRRRRRRR